MKHLTEIDRAKRMDKSYAEAVGLFGDLKTMFDRAAIVVEHLIDNVAARVEWKTQAAGRNPHQPIALTNEVAELERLSRIVATLQDPRLNDYRTGDPDGGAEICRILELARKEHGNGKESSNKEEAGKDMVSPEAGESGEGEAVSSSQIPTPERAIPASTDFHRRNSVRVERR